MNNKIIILTGGIQTGKTSFLQQFCAEKNNVAGILTPIVNGKRLFYDIAGKLFFEMEAMEAEEKLAIGKYLFSARAFEKANDILFNAGKRNDIEYLIVDEIGPLEVKQHKGLYDSFTAILNAPFNYKLVAVIRQALVEEVIKTFELNNVDVLSTLEAKESFKRIS
jgi:nucleoside-triphosphatase THEP1